MRDPQLEKIAANHYDPALPYHNFGHIRVALAAGDDIVTRCRARRQPLDEAATYYAILFHDAGYQEDQKAKGFAHKEDYSAKLAQDALTEKLVPPATIQLACEAIRATRKGYDGRLTPESMVVRAADLCQLAAPYPIFKANTVNLWREHERMSKEKMPWDQWKKKAIPEVEFFLDKHFYMEPGQKETEAAPFLKQTRANLAALAQDPDGPGS